MITKKYELTNEKIEYERKTLYRIRALRDFSDVKAGDLGGFVESEKNLSHEGDCWIYDDSKVIGRSKIVGYSKVMRKSIVNNSKVIRISIVENSTVKSGSIVKSSIVDSSTIAAGSIVDNSSVESSIVENSKVENSIVDYSTVESQSIVMLHSKVKNSTVMRKSKVDYSTIEDSTVIDGSIVKGSAIEHSIIEDSTVMCSTVTRASIVGNSIIEGLRAGANKCRFYNAKIESDADYIAIANIGSRNDTLTAYRCANSQTGVTTGCFTGSIDEFVAAVKDAHGDNKYAKDYLKAVELIKQVL